MPATSSRIRLAVVVAVVAVGCTDDDPDAGSTTSAATTTTTTTTATTTSVPGTSAPTTAATTTPAPTSPPASTAPALPTSPDEYATAFVGAWVAGDRDTASMLASTEAVDTLFAVDAGGNVWALELCEGAMGSSYCTFVDGAGVDRRAGRQRGGDARAVAGDRRGDHRGGDRPTAPPTSVVIPDTPGDYATAFIAAWVTGDRDAASVLATAEAVDALFAVDPGTSAWALDACDGAAGSSYCAFTDGAGGTIVVRVGNEAVSLAQPQAIGEVQLG